MNSSRPIWKGSISFGLVMIPVTLFPTDTHSDLHFHLLDKRNKARIRYERINEKTGKPVPWNQIAKAYEFEKGNYVIIDEQELEKTAYKNYNTIEIESFLDKNDIPPLYLEKAYYLSPSKQGEKGYALLQKTLESTQKAGIAKMVIRSRQHLAALLSYQGMLIINLLRFPEEIRSHKEFQIPVNNIKAYKISNKEKTMAERLIKSMSEKWNPNRYHDENRELLHQWIEKKIKTGGSIHEDVQEKIKKKPAKIIDFMTLLKKSIDEKEKRTGLGKTQLEHKAKSQPKLQSKPKKIYKKVTQFKSRTKDRDSNRHGHKGDQGRSKKKVKK